MHSKFSHLQTSSWKPDNLLCHVYTFSQLLSTNVTKLSNKYLWKYHWYLLESVVTLVRSNWEKVYVQRNQHINLKGSVTSFTAVHGIIPQWGYINTDQSVQQPWCWHEVPRKSMYHITTADLTSVFIINTRSCRQSNTIINTRSCRRSNMPLLAGLFACLLNMSYNISSS